MMATLAGSEMDPSRPDERGKDHGGSMMLQGDYSIFKASLQSGGGLIRPVFLPVQGPGLFAVLAAVFPVPFASVQGPGGGSAGCVPDAGVYSAGPEKKTVAAASDYIKTSPRFQDSGRGEALSADILRKKHITFRRPPQAEEQRPHYIREGFRRRFDRACRNRRKRQAGNNRC